MSKNFVVAYRTEISRKRVSDLLCCALEGGSNYWYRIVEFIEPPKLEFMSDAEDGIPVLGEDKSTPKVFRHLDYPLNEGGALMIQDTEENEIYRLDCATIEKGLVTMAAKYSSHFHDFMNQNEDAITGDVFLQCCVFDEVIYS